MKKKSYDLIKPWQYVNDGMMKNFLVINEMTEWAFPYYFFLLLLSNTTFRHFSFRHL